MLGSSSIRSTTIQCRMERQGAAPSATPRLQGASRRHILRDVSASVFGTWRAPPLVDGLDLRRFLVQTPSFGGTILLPRPQQQQQQQQTKQQEVARKQQQQRLEEVLQQQLEEQIQQQLKQQQAAAAAAVKKPLRIAWAGSGVYFWWQLGAMQYLSRRYDLTRVPMVGASGGAICAALARCGVDPEAIAESAYQLALDHKIWDKPMGLVGAWGEVIEQWLDELLPHDAAERCRGELGVVVTQLPAWQQLSIDDFEDKGDLINCVMASAHVPLLLDKQLSRRCRGVQCVDGSFPDFFTGENCDHLQCGGDAVMFDYFEDPRIVRSGRMDMLELKQYSQIKKLVLLGVRYAMRMESEGKLERFDLEPVRRK